MTFLEMLCLKPLRLSSITEKRKKRVLKHGITKYFFFVFFFFFWKDRHIFSALKTAQVESRDERASESAGWRTKKELWCCSAEERKMSED